MKGRLTYLAEGNENPNSSNYSKKLRVDERRGIVIGRGYRLYEKTDHNIIQDMQALGIDSQSISIMRKIHKLRGAEARKAIEKTNGTICLTNEQELKLFEKDYETCLLAIQNFISNNMFAYGTQKFQKMPEYQQDLLVDFYFAGDFDLKIQNLLLMSLGKTAKSGSDEVFNELIRDIELWKQLHVNPDRIKHRIIHVRESCSTTKIVKEERNQLIYGVPPEVVSGLILKRPDEYIVIGYQIDYSTEELLFILKPSLNIVDKGKESFEGINFADLITCLDILYDDMVKHKCIGISHIVNPENHEEDENTYLSLKRLKKVLYPDILEKKSILKGTKIEQDLIKILDFVHELAYDGGKTLTSFLANFENEITGGNELSLSPTLRKSADNGGSGGGEKQISVSAIPNHSKQNIRVISASSMSSNKIRLTKRSNSVQKQRNDSGVVIKNLKSHSIVKTENSPERKRMILDKTLYVGPRNAEVSWMNKLARLWINPKEISVLDYVIDNANEYFSIKDVEMKFEPKQMKKVKPSLIDDVPIDASDHPAVDLISQWSELSGKLIKHFPLLQRYKQIIKAWAFAERIYQKKVPIDLENLKLLTRRHKEGVAQKAYSGSPKRLSGKTPIDKGLKKKSNQGIEAGLVGIMIGLDQELSYKNSPDLPPRKKKENERDQVAQNFFRDHNMEEKNKQKKEVATLEKGTFKLKFPLLRKGSCSVCEKSLSFLEVCSAIGNKYLCSLHHPKSCQRCYRFPQGENVIKLGDHVYHMDCMVCQKCKKPLSIGNTYRTNEYLMHIKCPETSSMTKDRSNSLDQSSLRKNNSLGSFKNLKTLKFNLTKRT